MSEFVILDFIDQPTFIHGFPWRSFTITAVLEEFTRLRKRLHQNYTFPLVFSRVGYKCTDIFFQYERLHTRSNTNVSCVDYWIKRKDKIIKYWKSQKIKKDLFGTIVYMKRCPSHFSPTTAGMIYKYFNAKKVYDPYAGWGDRCIASMALGIEYLGVDSNPNLAVAYLQLINLYGDPNKTSFISGRSENIETNYVPDLVFTSPPFWKSKSKLVEYYTNCIQDFEDFFVESLMKVFSKYFGIVPIVLHVNDFMLKKLTKEYGHPIETLSFYSSVNKKTTNHSLQHVYRW